MYREIFVIVILCFLGLNSYVCIFNVSLDMFTHFILVMFTVYLIKYYLNKYLK